MTATDTPGGRFDIGRVIQQTFGVIGRNASSFFLLAAILVAAPALVVGLVQLAVAPTEVGGMPNFSAPGVIVGVVSFVVSVVGSGLLQVALVQATMKDLNGEKPAPMSSLGLAMSLVAPAIGLSLVATIGMTIGMILLVVPGVILAVMWVVGLPALVVEKKGVFDSLQRSRELTKGSRWPIFALSLVYVVVFGVVFIVIGGLTGGLAAAGGFTASSIVALIISSAATLVTSVLAATGAAVIYSELRTAKEGVAPDQLASVFD